MAFVGHILHFGYQDQLNMPTSKWLKFHNEAIKIFEANQKFQVELAQAKLSQ
jgi:hypothetical protein